MDWLMQFSNQLPALGLVVLRSTGLFFTAPLFAQQRIPVIVRALFAITLAVLVFPFIAVDKAQIPANTINWLLAGALEVTRSTAGRRP
ncbi:MAG: hypothetical protein CVV27_06170 [Candidatus Melainabacteria bacterium HGW-Melainabacteria-1]|nr:MAG: hypothetical protein CVV27_06170 [Candidatus Melainabacteria bacterium HGW-Melainabacteria-1]